MPISDRGGNARRICLCDSEVSYGEHLMEYLRSRGNLPYEIYLYTGLDMFMARENPDTTKLLVIAESQFSDALEKAGFTDVLLLNESSTYMEKPENMSKYQSVEHICAKIQQLCMSSEEEPLPQSVRHGNPMKLIGVYSPVTRCLQTTFSTEAFGGVSAIFCITTTVPGKSWRGSSGI